MLVILWRHSEDVDTRNAYFLKCIKNTVEGRLPKCLYLPIYTASNYLFITVHIPATYKYGSISLQLWFKLCSTYKDTTGHPVQSLQWSPWNSLRSSVLSLLWFIDCPVRSEGSKYPVQHVLQGLSPPGKEHRNRSIALELLDESNYAKLPKVSVWCDC